jgi:hypothetical protein
MITRRTLLGFGAAGIAAAALPQRSFGSVLVACRRGSVRALFQGHYAESLGFGEAMTARGVEATRLEGDLAQAWYAQLRPALLQRRQELVGLTDRLTLFCLEELARDVGLRVVGRIDHAVDPGGAVRHRATGSPGWLAASRRLGTRSRFGESVAALLVDPAHLDRFESAHKLHGPYSPPGKTMLVSWWMV